MNIKQQKAREALLMLLTPNNEKFGSTLDEARNTALSLTALGFGPVEIYVTPLITGALAADPFPISEVERYGFEEESLNYSGSSPNVKGFNLALRRDLLKLKPEEAFLRIFDEEHPGHNEEALKDAKLAMPGVQAAILFHIEKSLKLAFPTAE